MRIIKLLEDFSNCSILSICLGIDAFACKPQDNGGTLVALCTQPITSRAYNCYLGTPVCIGFGYLFGIGLGNLFFGGVSLYS